MERPGKPKTRTRAAPEEGRKSDSPLHVRSVEKAFRVLDAFNAKQPVMGLTQLANYLGIGKSEAQRFVYTLNELGYLHKDPVSKALQLTVKTLDLGHHYLRANPVVRGSSTYLTHLNTLTDETVSLAVLDGTEVVYVQRIVSRHVFNSNVVIGTRLPAYCTAAGMAILAFLDRDEARRILQNSDLKAHTPNTAYKLPDLLEKIEKTARQGYSVADSEYYTAISIGAPVCNARGEPVAAVTLAVSAARTTLDEAVRKYAPLVMEAARAIPA